MEERGMKIKCILIVCILFVSQAVIAAKAQNSLPPDSRRNRTAEATRVANNAISIDGKLDEVVWMQAQAYDHFTDRDPVDGAEPSYPTVFRVAYDDQNLYVGIRAFDSEPAKIKRFLTRRDEYTHSDWLYVSIDSYNDNRTAFEFGLNAAGVKHDLRRYDDENADYDWDAVWDGAVNIDQEGWTAEFKIPFRELRFTGSDDMEWGFQIYREFPRNNNELMVWNYWSKDESGFVSNYGTLAGLNNIETSNPLYVSPYVVGQSNISSELRNEVHPSNYELMSHLGGDVRYSFSNGLTFNATMNPDFGQVEADPADYNLTNFETYFAEKRPFFMEGGNILNFSLGIGDGDLSSNSLFYSRRIGRSPQISLDPANDDYITKKAPDVTKILSAAKLTGKTKRGLSVGVMDAVTSQEQGSIIYGKNNIRDEVVEPLTNYFLTRLQQDYRNGQTSVGGVLSGTNRRLAHTGITSLRSGAYTGGLDLNHEFFNRKYVIQAALAFSYVEGSKQAITETQMSSARYYQRPDANYVHVDSNATSLAGLGEKLVLGKSGGGHWRWMTGVVGSTPGFEINDLGYMPQVDRHSQFIWVQYREWQPRGILNEYSINLNQYTNWTNAPQLVGNGGNVNAHLTFTNNWRIGSGLSYNFSGWSTSALRGGPAIRTEPRTSLWTYLDTDGSKNLSFELQDNLQMANDMQFQAYSLSAIFRPRHNLQLALGPSLQKTNDSWAWVDKVEDSNGREQYIFSDMQQTTLSLTLRADLTLMPNLSIQYYAQPFLTAGRYSNYKAVKDPGANSFDDRFHTFTGNEIKLVDDEYQIDQNGDGAVDYSFSPGDFNYKQFRSNLVFRWEYMSGSILYLVWSQGYTNSEEISQFRMNRDLRTLFRSPGDNVLMLKLSYLMNI